MAALAAQQAHLVELDQHLIHLGVLQLLQVRMFQAQFIMQAAVVVVIIHLS
jgi:hypothetical protein